MLFCVIHPHSHAVHHSSGASRGERVAAVDASCVQVYACVINLFAYISKSVYARVCIVGINIPSVSLSALICTMCLCVKCVYVHVQCVCVYCESTGCPSGAAMLCRSASSLIAPISLWFAASYTHTYTVMYTLAHESTHTHTYTLDTTHMLVPLLFFFQEKEAEKWPFIYFELWGCGNTACQYQEKRTERVKEQNRAGSRKAKGSRTTEGNRGSSGGRTRKVWELQVEREGGGLAGGCGVGSCGFVQCSVWLCYSLAVACVGWAATSRETNPGKRVSEFTPHSWKYILSA